MWKSSHADIHSPPSLIVSLWHETSNKGHSCWSDLQTTEQPLWRRGNLAGVINSLRVSHGNDEMPTWSVTLCQVDNSDIVCEDRLWPGDLHQATRAVDDPCVVGTGHDLWHTLVCTVKHTTLYDTNIWTTASVAAPTLSIIMKLEVTECPSPLKIKCSVLDQLKVLCYFMI